MNYIKNKSDKMPYYVIVTGLPKTVKKQKMVHFLRQFVFKRPPVKFWIESLTPTSDSSNQMMVRFESKQAADKAAAVLQDYAFQHTDQQIYYLKCSISVDPEIKELAYNKHGPETKLQPVEHQRPYSPERSRSPLLNEELSKIQLEIELTNRKLMLVEAERKLIMEQKRLEMLQNAGPELVDSDAGEGRIKTLPPPKRERKRPQDQNNIAGENRGCKLYWPCRIIGKEMGRFVKMHIEENKRPAFYALMRANIKQRINNVLQGMVIFNTKKIISMYRNVYPMSTDEKFVLNLRDMMRQGQQPEDFVQQTETGSANANIDAEGNKKNIDPLDLTIDELSQDLDDWTEDGDTTN